MSKDNLAPIVLFVYNRPEHTRKTVEALVNNELASESVLYVFADGVKENATPEQIAKVETVREYIHTITGFKDVIIEESPKNKGLANSVIAGVTKVINDWKKVIVVEDDMLTSSHFLSYMNTSLSLYREDNKVACIHGYSIIKDAPIKENTYFQLGADCWGWGTWKRAWDLFNPNGKELLDAITADKELSRLFNYNGTYDYTGMLQSQIEGKIDSWAIRWQASAYVNRMLCLYPRKSLIQNIGFGEEATHCGSECYEASILVDEEITDFPKISIKESIIMRKEWESLFAIIHQIQRPTIYMRAKDKISSLIKRFRQ